MEWPSRIHLDQTTIELEHVLKAEPTMGQAYAVSQQSFLFKQRIKMINGHFRNLNWRYLPYITIEITIEITILCLNHNSLEGMRVGAGVYDDQSRASLYRLVFNLGWPLAPEVLNVSAHTAQGRPWDHKTPGPQSQPQPRANPEKTRRRGPGQQQREAAQGEEVPRWCGVRILLERAAEYECAVATPGVIQHVPRVPRQRWCSEALCFMPEAGDKSRMELGAALFNFPVLQAEADSECAAQREWQDWQEKRQEGREPDSDQDSLFGSTCSCFLEFLQWCRHPSPCQLFHIPWPHGQEIELAVESPFIYKLVDKPIHYNYIFHEAIIHQL